MIRFLNGQDFSAWATLVEELWKLTEEEKVKEFNDLMTSEKDILIGYFDNSLVGWIQVSLRTDYVAGTHSSPVGFIEGIVVTKTRRKEGIAKTLVEEAKKYALSKGCSEMGSDVEIDNEASIAFHKKIGFTEEERVVCFSKKI